jgi:hypothetical protein
MQATYTVDDGRTEYQVTDADEAAAARAEGAIVTARFDA